MTDENDAKQVPRLLDGVRLSGQFTVHCASQWQPAFGLSIRLFAHFFGRTELPECLPQDDVIDDLERRAHHQPAPTSLPEAPGLTLPPSACKLAGEVSARRRFVRVS